MYVTLYRRDLRRAMQQPRGKRLIFAQRTQYGCVRQRGQFVFRPI